MFYATFFNSFKQLAALFLLTSLLFSCDHPNKNKATFVPSEGQPTFGPTDAKVHVMVFEEPKCPNCKLFSTMIFPILKEDYIDTKKIRYTFIPVSFIPDSMPAAIAWLCVYHQDKTVNHDLLFKFVEYTYLNQPSEEENWATNENMIKFATDANLGIDIEELKKCLDNPHFQQLIEKNTAFGTELMKGSLDTPTVFVNGKEVEEVTYESIVAAIRG